MAKGNLWNDSFEQALEFGASTAKQSAQAVKQTFNPLKVLEQTTQSPQNSQDKGIEQTEKGKSNEQKHTPLDFDKLNEKYQDQDKQKLDGLRNRLHQLVKSDEQKAIEARKKQEEDRQKQFQQQDQEKERKEEQQRQQEAMQGEPQGKKRGSLFSPRKKGQTSHQEVKANKSKD